MDKQLPPAAEREGSLVSRWYRQASLHRNGSTQPAGNTSALCYAMLCYVVARWHL